MLLSEDDKSYLKKNGTTKKDIEWIECALVMSTFKFRGRRISAEKAICLLGQENFLSGLSRSAFHWSAVRNTEDGERVMFDSSRLCKGGA